MNCNANTNFSVPNKPSFWSITNRSGTATQPRNRNAKKDGKKASTLLYATSESNGKNLPESEKNAKKWQFYMGQ